MYSVAGVAFASHSDHLTEGVKEFVVYRAFSASGPWETHGNLGVVGAVALCRPRHQ